MITKTQMMIKKLFFWLVFFSVGVQAQNVNFTDDNFKAKLLEAGTSNFIAQDWSGNNIKIDTNNDGEIQISEAEYVSGLNVSNANIQNLDGLGSFNLNSLDCSGNKISRLDLSGMNNLSYLNCSNNQLKDLRYENYLEWLDCSYNQLTSIVLKGSIPNLILDNNLFTNLDFSNFEISNNISIKNNPNLFNINFKSINSSFKSYSKLNLQNSPNIQFICVNENDVSFVQNVLNGDNLTNSTLSVDCMSPVFDVNINNSYLKQILLGADVTNDIAKDSDGNSIKIDLNGDFKFQYSEIARVEELKITDNLNIGVGGVTDLNNLANLTKLVLNNLNISNIDINRFTKLKYLDLSNNHIQYLNYYSTLDLPIETFIAKNSGVYEMGFTNLKNLKYLDISNNPDVFKIDFSKNVNLNYLDISGLKKLAIEPGPYGGVIPITSIKNTKLVTFKAEGCNFKALPFTAMPTLENLYFSQNNLNAVNTIVGFPNLEIADFSNNKITQIAFSSQSNIQELYLQNNLLTALNVNVLSKLSKLALFNNPIASISCKNNSHESILSIGGINPFNNTTFTNICVDSDQVAEIKSQLADEDKSNVEVTSDCTDCNLINFTDPYFKNTLVTTPYAKDLNGNSIKIDANHDGEISICEAEQVSYLYMSVADIATMDEIQYFPNLNELIVGASSNNVQSSYNNLESLDLSKNIKLKKLELYTSLLTALDLTKNINIEYLYLAEKIPTIDLTNNTNLTYLYFGSNSLTSIDLTKNINLITLGIYGLFSTLDLSKNVNLERLNCDFNINLTELDISKNVNLKEFSCSGNVLIKSLDLSLNDKLEYLSCYNSSISTLDISKNINLKNVACGVSNSSSYPENGLALTTILAKNGTNEILFDNNTYAPNLKYVCVDESQLDNVQSYLAAHGFTNVSINTYCSFTPGGNYNTITGTAKYDSNSNGCDTSDNAFEYLKLKIDDGTTSGETFVQNDGKYDFFTQEGNFTVKTQAENPTLFNVSPASFATGFTDANNNTFTQNICVTANGTQNDAEVVIAPLTGARPGFDATYKLVWRNKGNTTLSGKVIMNFDSDKMTFKESSLPYAAISNGSLEFDYTNLKPYANDGAEITFTINTPTNPTNPVNSGDILAFHAQITPSNGDLTPEDNQFAFNHTVVNSFDPNDIVCMEGETIPSVAVGKYLHYVVNFENVGTAEAENIVVKMNINPAEFDINTLQLQNASADVTTRITGNVAEFIFKKIKLKSGGHGNVLLKMRSVTNLQEGDQVNNKANIYFDYNFPVETNNYVTTIQDLNSVLAAKINYTADNFAAGNYPVNFDASLSTGDIVSYVWEFSGTPAVSSTTTANPVVTYSVPGNYTATLTVYDVNNNASSQTISFKVGDSFANLSTGKDSNGNSISIDSDDDDWKGYDINGVQITPKVRHTYNGWSSADIGDGSTSQWITLNTSEGYSTYKSIGFTIPENATDAKLNLRSLSFTRNWTYLVKVNPDGSEDETEITRTQFLGDGAKGWLNSRSPQVDNYALLPGRYYIKVLVYSSNGLVRQSMDVNAVVSCSAGLMYINKKAAEAPTLGTNDSKTDKLKIYPIPTRDEINLIANDYISNVEVYDSAGRIVQKQIFDDKSKSVKMNIRSPRGVYYLKIKTTKEIITQKIIKE